MQCPKCNIEMDEVRKLDVIVDSCSKCGGIWLDKGELDALREAWTEHRSASNEHTESRRERFDERDEHHDKHRYDDRHDKHHDEYKGGHKKKRGSILDMLDMFGG